MKVLIFGGTGFVGLNIAQALLARGHAVTLFDRAGLPPAAQKAFADHADRLTTVQGDVTDRQAVEDVIAAGFEVIILAAAINAGPEREAAASAASSIFRPARLTARTRCRTCRSTKRPPAIRFRSTPLPNSHPRRLRRVWPSSGNPRSSAYGSAPCSDPGSARPGCATR